MLRFAHGLCVGASVLLSDVVCCRLFCNVYICVVFVSVLSLRIVGCALYDCV